MATNERTRFLKHDYTPSGAPGPSKWPPQEFPGTNYKEAFHALNEWAKELHAWGERVSKWVDKADAQIKGTGVNNHIVGDPPPPPFDPGTI